MSEEFVEGIVEYDIKHGMSSTAEADHNLSNTQNLPSMAVVHGQVSIITIEDSE
jgi:hypothetical protein